MKPALIGMTLTAVMVFMLAPRAQPVYEVTVWEPPTRFAVAERTERTERTPEPLPDLDDVEAYARSKVGDGEQWECLYELWWHESKWDSDAAGPTNDHGIPQANADAHPETDSDVWRADGHEQVRWGIEYIKNRYGTFCDAWDAWKDRGTQRSDGTWHGGWY